MQEPDIVGSSGSPSQGLAKALAERGLCAADVPGLAAAAAAQWTGTFHPRPLDDAALRGRYERCLA